MLFNKQLLFIHVPKTGGMAATKFLLDVLPGPVYYTHPDHDAALEARGIVQIRGYRHETIEEASAVVEKHGLSISQFQAIIAVIRNPYALEVSRFAYLQKGHPWDRGRNQELALMGDFEKFAIQSRDHGDVDRPIQTYLLLNNRLSDNLKILRSENLEAELMEVLRSLGLETDRHLPRDNQSQHDDPVRYYTRVAEEAVYRRYQWIFDRGYYPRFDFESLPTTTTWYPITGSRIPLEGPVRQIGVTTGLSQDLWVGKAIQFHIRAEEEIEKLVIEGLFPKAYQQHIEFTVDVAGDLKRYPVNLNRDNTPVCLELDCHIPAGTNCRIAVTASASWSPQQLLGTSDARELSFRLSAIRFSAKPVHLVSQEMTNEPILG